MSGHTPGPWHVVPRLTASENSNGFSIVCKPKAFSLAHVQPIDQDGIEGEDNARLIAAAPDLLEACKWLLTCMDAAGWKDDAAAVSARAAIAKAIGAA